MDGPLDPSVEYQLQEWNRLVDEFEALRTRLSEPGRRLLLWLLEQQDTEREIQADDDTTRREMKTKIAELRRRPVGPLSELEETVIREALAGDDGRVGPGTFWGAQTALLDIYFKPATAKTE